MHVKSGRIIQNVKTLWKKEDEYAIMFAKAMSSAKDFRMRTAEPCDRDTKTVTGIESFCKTDGR